MGNKILLSGPFTKHLSVECILAPQRSSSELCVTYMLLSHCNCFYEMEHMLYWKCIRALQRKKCNPEQDSFWDKSTVHLIIFVLNPEKLGQPGPQEFALELA